MSLAKSLCNKTIIKNDLKRYWWMSAMYAGMIFLVAVMPFLTKYMDGASLASQGKVFESSRFYSNMVPSVVMALIAPVFMGVTLFSYLQKSATVTTYHSYPAKRGTLYFSHIISGVILMSAAVGINAIILFISRFDHDIWLMMSMKYLAIWVIVIMLYSVLSFSLSVLCSIVCGNTVSAFVLTYIIGALPAFVELVGIYIASMFIFGFEAPPDSTVIKHIYYHLGNVLDNGFRGVWIYIAFTVIFTALGLVLYKKRNLENHSAVLAFQGLRPVLIYSFGICIGILGYLYTTALEYGGEYRSISNIMIMIPFGIIGIIIAKMLIAWTFKPKGLVKPIAIYCVFVAVAAMFFSFDISGYERRIPKLDDIEFVSFDYSYIYGHRSDSRYINGQMLVKANQYDNRITDKNSIADVLRVHKEIVDAKIYDNTGESITLYYKLKDGGKLYRRYQLPDCEQMRTIFNMPEERMRRFEILRDNPIKTIGMSMGVSELTDGIIIIDESRYEDFINAMKADALIIPYDEYNKTTAIYINIDNIYDALDADGNMVRTAYTDAIHMSITPSCKNTIALLKEVGAAQILSSRIESFSLNDSISISDAQKKTFICDRFISNGKIEGVYSEKGLTTGSYNDSVLTLKVNTSDDSDKKYKVFMKINASEEEYNWLIAK